MEKERFSVKYLVISAVLVAAAFALPCFSRAVSAEDIDRKRPTIEGTSVHGISYTTYKITKETSYSQQSGNTYGTSSTLNVVREDKTIPLNSVGKFTRTGDNVDIVVYTDDVYAIANRMKAVSEEYNKVMDDMPDVYSKAVIAWQ